MEAYLFAIIIPLVLAAIVVVVILVLCNTVYIVHQAEEIVIERFGRFHKVLYSGLNFVAPLSDKPRTFAWKKVHITPDGHITEVPTAGYRIDKRENMFNFPPQEVLSRDTVSLTVNALMYYSIQDSQKAVYEVDDLQNAIAQTAQTQIKEIFGNMNFNECLTSQQRINDYLVAEFSRTFSSWGLVVNRMEILELHTRANIADAMKKQMVAERMRRGEFIKSEGKKAALRLRAEGSKVVSIQLGMAEQEATRKVSEGESIARISLARAESSSLEKVASVLTAEGSSNSGYMMSQRYLDLFRTMMENASAKTVYLPYLTHGLSGVVANLPSVYGPGNKSARSAPASRGGSRAATPTRAAPVPPAGQDFSDLN